MSDVRDNPSLVPPALGRLLAVDPLRGIAWFEGEVELRRCPLGPAVPAPIRMWQPVFDPVEAVALAEASLLHPSPPNRMLWSASEDRSLGWVLREFPGYWEASPSAFAAAIAVKSSSSPVRIPLLGFVARALARVSPDTLASVDEMQQMTGLRTSLVRSARPAAPAGPGRAIRARVGPWLDVLLAAAPAPAQEPPGRSPRRRRSHSQLRPLGGPARAQSPSPEEES